MNRARFRGLVSAAAAAIAALVTTAAEANDLCAGYMVWQGDRIPYCRNRRLKTYAPGVTQAIIVVHGSGRDRADYDKVIAPARDEGVLGYTTVVAPQFLISQDLTDHSLPSQYIYWHSNWRYGARSATGQRRASYEWVDRMVRRLLEYNPDLEHIAVVGHSAGGMFVHRYAGTTEVVEEAAAEGVGMSFGVQAPSAYLWLNEKRPEPIPATCPEYNEYQYGLEDINSWAYMSGLDVDQIREDYFHRHIYYIVGTADTVIGPGLDKSCSANTQGPNRYERARNFTDARIDACVDHYAGTNRFLRWVYRSYCQSYGRLSTPLQEVAGVGHSSRNLYDSVEGRNILFCWD